MQKGIVVATLHEAKIIIQTLNLKASNQKFDIYQNDRYILIISGIGRLNSAIATTYLLSNYNIDICINIGIAGSKDKNISDMYLINKITDNTLQKDFFPDILLKHNLKETNITTYDTAVFNSKSINSGLVDMECSSYFFASSKFLPPHKIMAIKIVSDNLTPDIITKEYVQMLIQKNIDSIIEFFEYYNFYTRNILTKEEQNLIDKISKNLNLSFNTNLQLNDKAKYLKLNNKFEILKDFENITVEQKDEQSKVFHTIRQL